MFAERLRERVRRVLVRVTFIYAVPRNNTTSEKLVHPAMSGPRDGWMDGRTEAKSKEEEAKLPKLPLRHIYPHSYIEAMNS